MPVSQVTALTKNCSGIGMKALNTKLILSY